MAAIPRSAARHLHNVANVTRVMEFITILVAPATVFDGVLRYGAAAHTQDER